LVFVRGLFRVTAAALICLILGCGDSGNADRSAQNTKLENLPDRAWLAMNAFAYDPRFGSMASQFLEVRDTLKIHMVRLLFSWNDQVQPDPALPPDFQFFDALVNALPDGVDALVLLTGVPSWMHDSSYWENGDPRATFVDLWAAQIMTRYGSNPKIVGWEIWNEPDDGNRDDNGVLDLPDNPANFVQLLALAQAASRRLTPDKLVVSGATTSITDNFPDKLAYNEAMALAGAEAYVDVWGVHFYGRDFDPYLAAGGVAAFLNLLQRPIWVTESGARGVDRQLAYYQEVWPFLRATVPGIARIYCYQFTEDDSPGHTYGLRNLSTDSPYSDLYLYLAAQ
jgi:hypothetical protein